jgi:diguanylate cyclase (GGDEF)-like protein
VDLSIVWRLLGKLGAWARKGRANAEASFERLAWMQSLPSRLILGVFSTVLVTSLAVAVTATRSTESFLRDKIDHKFPAVLERTSERLGLWFAQRQLDVETFARSQIVEDHLTALAQRGRRGAAGRSRAEVESYLSYVLERFPQYEALFLLGPEGQLLLGVGVQVALPDAAREPLGGLEQSRVSDFQPVGGAPRQVASAPVRDAHGERVGSLHAVLAPDQLDALLRSEYVGETAWIVAVGARGELLAPRESRVVPAPGPGNPPGEVHEHVLPDGERVIASWRPFERFDWALWVVEPYDAAFAPVVAMVRRVWAVNLAIVLVLGAVAYWIARSMARPIHDLSLAARRIAEGAEDVVIPVSGRADEVGVLTQALREMTARLSEKHEALLRANEVLTQLSITDGLTSLHNHRAFQDRLARDTRRARRTQTPLCLALIDVDNFKSLNDHHGHATGDRLLASVAEILQDRVGEADFAARYGGEEFALLTPVPIEAAITTVENLRRAIADAAFEVESGEAIRMTVSIGVAAFETDANALFDAADRALYEAKHSGKDCVVAAD